MLERLILLATVVGADDEDEAANLLRRVPDLQDASEAVRRTLARWYHDLEQANPLFFRPIWRCALS